MPKLNFINQWNIVAAEYLFGDRIKVSIHNYHRKSVNEMDDDKDSLWSRMSTLCKDGNWYCERDGDKSTKNLKEMLKYLESDEFKDRIARSIIESDKRYQQQLDDKEAYPLFEQDAENAMTRIKEILKEYPGLKWKFQDEDDDGGMNWTPTPNKVLFFNYNSQNYIGEKA